MSDVKRYYVGINTKCLGGIGLVEMTDLYREATGFDGLVMGKDYDAIKVENESLRSDIQSWRLSIEAERNAHKLSMKGIQDEIDRLNGPSFTVELAALRKDAERYRRIKLDASMDGSLIERLDCNIPVKLWDSAIDRELVK